VTRRFPFLLLAALLVGLLAGCGDGSLGRPAAATVNGTVITRQSLFDDLDALASSATLRAEGGISGASDGSYAMSFVSQVLSARIVDVLVRQELDRRGVQVTDADRQQASDAFDQGYGELATELPEAFRDRQIEALAAQGALARSLGEEEPEPTGVTEADIRAYYDDNIDRIMEQVGGEIACVSHILVSFSDSPAATDPTPDQEQAAREEADELAARLAAGEDFEVVATAESDDPGSAQAGGDLGCQPPDAGFVAEFEEAMFSEPVGEVSEPFRTEFGYHLVLVRSRGIVPFEEVRDQIEALLQEQAQAQSQSPLGAWITQAIRDADVDVDPQFGSFAPEQAPQSVVAPPEGPTGAEVTLPGLGTPTP
jgi:parvulin-like peptidyl-prolyl isomerase